MTHIVTLSLGALGLCLVWRLVRDYIVPSPFENIAGPPPGSIWAGESPITTASVLLLNAIIGNVLQLFEHNNWNFVKDLVETYGPIARFQSFLGVSFAQHYDPLY